MTKPLHVLIVFVLALCASVLSADVSLNGPDTDYLTCGTGLDDLWDSGGMTLWIAVKETGDGDPSGLNFLAATQAGGNGWSWRVNNFAGSNHWVDMHVDASTDSRTKTATNSMSPQNAWRSVAMTWNGDNPHATNDWQYSIDGETETSIADFGPNQDHFSDTGNTFYIGTSAALNHFAEMVVTGFMACREAYTQDQLNAITQTTDARKAAMFCPSGDLDLLLLFENGKPGQTQADVATVVDHSPGSNNCTFVDGSWTARETN